MRILVIDSHPRAQIQALLSPTLSRTEAAAALESLRALNPQVSNFDQLQAGEVLFVPESPSFTASASRSAAAAPFDEFRASASNALRNAAERLKVGNDARSAERTRIAEAIKLASATQSDFSIKQRLVDAGAELEQEEKDDRQTVTDLEASSKAALTALEQLSKLFL
jgi:hypothetical protein